jgi:hypothetical protein|tara:strand:- start:2029 stop:2304 length:276 start_codon:yes stop_codon:yes gene_type:complete
MQNNYKGYSLFNDVEDASLRTWNRCTVMCNGSVDQGDEFAEEYGECLSEVDRLQVVAMMHYINVKGTEAVRLEISTGKHTKISAKDGEVIH